MKVKILIVDDDPTSLKAVGTVLESNGFEVKISPHAEDIEKNVKEFDPSLIVMDLLMPNVDGTQAVKRLQTYPALSKIPVIFLTAVKMRDDDRNLELEVNVDGRNYRTLTKPLDAKVLLAEIRTLTSV